jgi:hypothetical protein
VSIIDSFLSLADSTGLAALVTVMALSFHPPLSAGNDAGLDSAAQQRAAEIE